MFLILSNCNVKPVNKTHGVAFLDLKEKKIILNKSNKNDVVKHLGPPAVTGTFDENIWIYVERTLSKGKYHKLGRHTLKTNNVLVLYFDKYGILKEKKFYNKDDIAKINFSKNKTENELAKKSFVETFLQSIRQKMYGNR